MTGKGAFGAWLYPSHERALARWSSINFDPISGSEIKWIPEIFVTERSDYPAC